MTKKASKRKPRRIFSGPESERMWNEINDAKNLDDLKWALYTVGCKLQELESVVRRSQESKATNG